MQDYMRKGVLFLMALGLGVGSQGVNAQPLAGVWEGKLALPGGASLRIVFNVEATDGGGWTATMDSPDQGARGIPVGEVKVSGTGVRFEVQAVAGHYEGTLSAEGTTLDGTWHQGGQAFTLDLAKAEGGEAEPPQRPQTPQPPYPYRSEDVRYPNPQADLELAGTLTVPEGEGPFPAALLISGSGPQDRDETIMDHRPFRVLADHLTRQGIAVLRFDDRGIGASTGDFGTATSADFATDVAAGVAYLSSRAEIDATRIGLIGHSEGGLIAPMVAADDPELHFLVLLAGPGLTGREILKLQAALIARANGAPEGAIQANADMQERLFEVVAQVEDPGEARTQIQQILQGQGMADAPARAQAQQLTSPWFKFFLSYDPVPALGQVGCPVLALNGEKDLQVPPKENLEAIAAALAAGGNTQVETQMLPGLNHLFQTATTGSPLEYAQIEETFSPDALARISTWILALP